MPARLLPVEHRIQEAGAGCLAACAQMVLRHVGLEQSQRHLNQLLGLTSIGVPYTNITRLTGLGVQVAMLVGDEAQLKQAIDLHLPVIAFLFTGDLPYWQANTPHAVVVVGYDDTHLYLNDPAFAIAPQSVQWDAFMLAWSEMDYAYAAITRA
jgi:ABC-type bacteriocin/lantibiotic exporter with double-glycine peptidase domain